MNSPVGAGLGVVIQEISHPTKSNDPEAGLAGPKYPAGISKDSILNAGAVVPGDFDESRFIVGPSEEGGRYHAPLVDTHY